MILEELRNQFNQITALEESGELPAAELLLNSLLSEVQSLSSYSELSDTIHEETARFLCELYLLSSRINYQLGNLDKAEAFAKESMKFATEINHPGFESKILSLLSKIFHARSNYHKAIEYSKKSLAISEQMGNKIQIPAELHNLGISYIYISEYLTALDYLHKALILNEESGNKFGEANNLLAIGAVYSSLMDFSRALEFMYRALEIRENHPVKSDTDKINVNIGLAYAQQEDYPRALEYYFKGLAVQETRGDKIASSSTLCLIADACIALSDYNTALKYALQSLSMAEEIGAVNTIADCLISIGNMFAEKKFEGYSPEKAEIYFYKAIDISKETGAKTKISSIHCYLADLYESEKRWEEFAFHIRTYHKMEKEILSEDNKRYAEKFALERQTAEKEKQLAIERVRAQATDDILSNILPANVMERLIKGEKKLADTHENVSILFVDIVGFTKISSQLRADELLELLDIVFSRFDSICKRHGLEKIKTIGDAYMAVCGAPVACENNAERCALAAMEMLEEFEISRNFSIPIDLRFRIGLHSGSVVAGIIGENKYSYDLWGDAVNTASRMESYGEPDKIHVSEEFRNSAGDKFIFSERGEMNIKGKGMMKTYFLEKE